MMRVSLWAAICLSLALAAACFGVGMGIGNLQSREQGYLLICRNWVREHAWDMKQREYMQAMKRCEHLKEGQLDD